MDDSTDDTAAIQSAINDGNIIIIPPGTYVISDQILIPSNRHIKLMPGAIFFRKSNTGKQHSNTFNNSNFFANSDPVNGNTNIVIEGGIFDGNQANQPTVERGSFQYCGSVAMRFLNVTHLTIRDCVFKNNIIFNVQIGRVNHFLIENIAYYFSGVRPNQDGVHVNGPASNGVIRNIWSSGGNDALIALNANDDTFGLMCEGDIQNILVENVTVQGIGIPPYVGCAIMLLNSSYNISDVMVRNFHGMGYQAVSAICLEAFEGTGAGIIDRVIFEGIDVGTPCVNDSFCTCGLNCGDVKFVNCRWRVGAGANDGVVQSDSQSFFYQKGANIGNLTFENCSIIGHNDPTYAAFRFDGSVETLMLSNTVFTRPSNAVAAGYLVDAGIGTVGIACINGVACSKLEGLVNNPINIGTLSANGIASSPGIS